MWAEKCFECENKISESKVDSQATKYKSHFSECSGRRRRNGVLVKSLQESSFKSLLLCLLLQTTIGPD